MYRLIGAIVVVVALGRGEGAFGQGSGSSRIAPPRSSAGQVSGSSRTAPPRSNSQGSGSSRTAPPRSNASPEHRGESVPRTPRPPTVAEFAAAFWRYLHKPSATYHDWGSPGKTAVLNTQGHHGAYGQTYLNNVANRALQQLPIGSVLVRDEYTDDQRTLRGISVMYRAKAADPKNGNWYWMVFRPDGKLARTPPEQGNRPIAGRVRSCIECHRQAGGGDFVFLNDQPPPGNTPGGPRR